MDYINKENFIAFIDKKIDKNGLGYVIGSQLKDYINKQPTADVVEVVKCKDCKFFKLSEKTNRAFCDWHREDFETYADDFCSYGERKEQ